MLTEFPLYCKKFHCIADRCTDSCCVGWEIEIDTPTAEYYKAVSGCFGERLRSNIDGNDTFTFRLKNERCPFLNEKNLCDIIINLGEHKLCQICRDHPRYFEWYADKKEGGIGLCCEEAARIIVTSEDKFETYMAKCDDEGYDDYNSALYEMLSFARNEIIDTLENDSLSLKDRLCSVSAYAEKIQFMADNYVFEHLPIHEISSPETEKANIDGFLESFSQLESIDENWDEYFSRLIASSDTLANNLLLADTTIDLYLKNIAVYFIWRYFLKGVFDEEILSKVRLMAVSVAMIKLMYLEAELSGECLNGEKCSMLAKNYSKEIEYSEENLEKIYDMCYNKPAFSVENILSII